MFEGGLRERKNRQTQESIARAAFELILERGYDSASIADIAERADVAPRTIYGWFPHKADIVFPQDLLPLRRLRRVLAGSSFSTIDRLTQWLEEEAVLARHSSDPLQDLRVRAIMSDATLRGQLSALLHGTEDAIAEAVADETGLAPGDVGPRAFAAATTSMLLSLLECTPVGGAAPVPQLAQGMALLRGAIEALGALDADAPQPG